MIYLIKITTNKGVVNLKLLSTKDQSKADLYGLLTVDCSLFFTFTDKLLYILSEILWKVIRE